MNQSSIAYSSATGGGGASFLAYTSGVNSGGLQGVGGGGGGGMGGSGANGGNSPSANTHVGGGGGGPLSSASGQSGGNSVGGNGGTGGNPGTVGGAGSFGGGGGGGGSADASNGASSGGNGGAGGFGGGGGATGFRTAGGAGGFGGGGGGSLPGYGLGSAGSGGAFGGAGQNDSQGYGYGGGGAGLGGAIFVYQGTANLNNVSLVGNSVTGGTGFGAGSAAGAGIFNYSGAVTLHNATLADNTATATAGSFSGPNGNAQGAAIYNYKATGLATPTVSLYNSALASNTVITQGSSGANAPVEGDIVNPSGATGGTVTANGVNHNFIGASSGTISGGAVLSGTPYIDFPGIHGGLVMTPPETGSPLVGAGDPSTSLAVDETGATRSNSTPSIGAFEGALPNPFPLPTGTVVVSESTLGALIAIDPSTGNRETISAANVLGSGPALVNPTAVAFDNNGNIYVVAGTTSSSKNLIYKVDPTNGNRTLLSGNGAGTGTAFSVISAIAYNPASGSLLATDSSAKAIYSVSTSTGNRTLLSNNTTPNSANPFATPTSIVYNGTAGIVEGDKNFDTTNYSGLLQIASDGTRTVFSDSTTPNTTNQIGTVAGIANASDGSILMIDQRSNPSGGSHPKVLDSVATTGTPGARTLLATLPTTGGSGGSVTQYGVAADSGGVYVTEKGSTAADTQVLRQHRDGTGGQRSCFRPVLRNRAQRRRRGCPHRGGLFQRR
jgi:hypothetical protein